MLQAYTNWKPATAFRETTHEEFMSLAMRDGACVRPLSELN